MAYGLRPPSPGRGLLWGPCMAFCPGTREGSLGRSPLADGAHDVVGAFPLVEPRVVAVAHQLAGLRLVPPHVLAEVPKVHVGELLQAQHSCAGTHRQCPRSPRGEARGRLQFPACPGRPCAPVPNLDSWVKGACFLSQEDLEKFLSSVPDLAPRRKKPAPYWAGQSRSTGSLNSMTRAPGHRLSLALQPGSTECGGRPLSHRG